MLSPRPTLRYSLQGQYGSGALHSASQSRAESKRDPRPFSSRTIEESNTIDEYANDMDARTLRELMDRDNRRQERKRKNDQDRAQRRLDRHAARGQAEAESRTRPSRRREQEIPREQRATEPGPSGVVKEYTQEMRRRADPTVEHESIQDPFADPEPSTSTIEPPVAIRHVHPEPMTTVPYSQTYESPPASPARHMRQPSNISQSTDPRTHSLQDLSQTGSNDLRPTESNNTRRGSALAALFRRSGVGKRGAPSQQSFSNTSRESMGTRYTPPPDTHERTYRRPSSGAPIRTKSIFREDLPESPLSPPESRVQSPEAGEFEDIPPLPSEQGRLEGLNQLHSQRESYDSAAVPSVALLSQSLASVDSEGSWLSGRPRKRASQQLSLGRSSLPQRSPTIAGRSTDDLGIYEDQQGRRSYGSYGPLEQPSGLSKVHSAVGDSEDATPNFEEDEDKVMQGSVSRQPTVVHRQPRIQSSEGLLRQYTDETPDALPTPSEQTDADEYETADETSPQVTPSDRPASSVAQATQGYGLTHARTISAGSARLLDIPARRDSWRRSVDRTPTPPQEQSSSHL